MKRHDKWPFILSLAASLSWHHRFRAMTMHQLSFSGGSFQSSFPKNGVCKVNADNLPSLFGVACQDAWESIFYGLGSYSLRLFAGHIMPTWRLPGVPANGFCDTRPASRGLWQNFPLTDKSLLNEKSGTPDDAGARGNNSVPTLYGVDPILPAVRAERY